MAKKKAIIDEIDNLEDIKKDEFETLAIVEEQKKEKLKELKESRDNIKEEFTVFDYDDM